MKGIMNFSSGQGLQMLSILVLAFTPFTAAYWRMPCMGVVARGRYDPIVDFGNLSAHVHTIKGSSGISIDSETSDLLGASCTSCQITQDKSAYWAPELYFWGDDGGVEAVGETPGHLTYYKYVPAFTADGTYTYPEAIPNGFQFVSGNAMRRNFTLPTPDPPLPWSGSDATQDALEQKAIGFNCLNYAATPEGSLQRHTLPSKEFLDANCPDGLRLEVLFPICWNGQDLTSPNHKSHVAYSDAGLNGGRCPAGYDHVINQIFFETIYPVGNYKGRAGKFVLSNGDPTGCGYHGDTFIAWDEGVLAQATEQCGSPTGGPGASGVVEDCPVFITQSSAAQAACQIEGGATQGALAKSLNNVAAPAIGQVLNALPGSNPLQYGPEPATLVLPGGSSSGPALAPPAPIASPPLPPIVSAPAAPLHSALAPAEQPPAKAQVSSVANAPIAPPKSVAAAPPKAVSTTQAVASAPLPSIAAAPKPTEAPAAAPVAPAAGGDKVVGTSTYTSDGALYIVQLLETDVTVTVTATGGAAEPSPANAKRHLHEHLAPRHHHHHGRHA